MRNELPYKELLTMQMEDGNIAYQKVNSDDKLDAYIISFPNSEVTSLSTLLERGKSGKALEEAVIEALMNSEQGQSFVEVSYLEEHLALVDCRDYSVEEDINAYVVYMQLSEETGIYGAIHKGYTLAEFSKLIGKKKAKIDPKDREATERIRSLERNVMQDRLKSIYK